MRVKEESSQVLLHPGADEVILSLAIVLRKDGPVHGALLAIRVVHHVPLEEGLRGCNQGDCKGQGACTTAGTASLQSSALLAQVILGPSRQ